MTGERIWSSNFLYVDTLLTPRYTVGIPTREAVENQLGLWEWEAYTSWTETSDLRKSYLPLRAFKHPWFYISGDRLLLKEDAPITMKSKTAELAHQLKSFARHHAQTFFSMHTLTPFIKASAISQLFGTFLKMQGR